MLNTSTCTIENSFFTIDVSLPLYYAREDRTDKMDHSLFRFLFSFSSLDTPRSEEDIDACKY